MRSTFSGLNMALLGLNASQKALDVTGQNLTNINTSGYTRQRLDQVSISPTGASPFMSKYSANVGQGVLITGVSQIRDPFLDVQFRNQITKVGTDDAKNQILSQIGNVFDNVDVSTIQTALDDVVKQLQTLTGKVGQDGNDSIVRSSFETLLSYFHQNGTDLSEIKSNLETKMDNTVVPAVNEILTKITELNESIKNSQILGNPALELKDQRNALIDDLATYLPIEVTYDTVMRGETKVESLNITIPGMTTGTAPDEKPVYLIKDGDCAEFSFEIDGNGKGVLSMEKDASGEITTKTDITDQLDRGILKGNLDMLNKEGDFDGSDTKGIGYYQKMLDTFVSTLATKMNELNVEAGGEPLFVNSTLDESDPAVDATQGITAGNIKISDGWMNGTTKLMASKDPSLSTAPDNLLRMEKLLTTEELTFEVDVPDGLGGTTKKTIYTGTMPGAYTNIQAQFGIEKQSTESILNNHTTVLQEASDARESVMGVNLDEEVMNMMRYQQSYNAAARLMTAMDEILDKLINSTGVVGR